jgi:predicted nucleotidyltransferase
MSEVERIKQYRFVQTIAQLPVVRAIYLFGSRARGGFFADSDIDLAIDCPKATDHDWNRILQIIEQADTLYSIDCVRLDKVKAEFLANIMQDKKMLFERRSV